MRLPSHRRDENYKIETENFFPPFKNHSTMKEVRKDFSSKKINFSKTRKPSFRLESDSPTNIHSNCHENKN